MSIGQGEPSWWHRIIEQADDDDHMAALIEAEVARGADVNSIQDSHQTALYWAVVDHRGPVIDTLLRLGAKPDAEIGHDETSLHIAAAQGDAKLIKRLLDAGSDAVRDQADYVARSALAVAAEHGRAPAISVLIAGGCNVNENCEAVIGDPPLTYAIENGHVACVKRLLEAGADPRVRGWMQITPFHRATEYKGDNAPEILAMITRAMGRGRPRKR